MRSILTLTGALLIAACGADPSPFFGGQAAAPAAGQPSRSANSDDTPACTARQSHPVAFTAEDASDRLMIEVDAPTCPEAAALVTLRDESGTLLLTEAFPLKALALSEPPSTERLHALLSSFTENVTRRPASELEPFDEATTEGPGNPAAIRLRASREIYERARTQGGNVICFPIHYENFQCVWHDAGRGASFVLYNSGP